MIEISAIQAASSFSASELEILLRFVSPGKRERLSAYARRRDQQHSLLGDLLARFLIRKRLDLKNSDIKFSFMEKGKPYLAAFPEVQFSISHSGDWVVCATNSHPLGVDVQQLRGLNMDIAHRYFSAAENSDLLACAEHERQLYFFQLWAMKESYLKAIGLGITRSLQNFTIARRGDTVFGIKKKGQWLEGFQLKLYQLDANHPVAVCAASPSFPAEIQIIDWQECINF